MRMLIKSIKNGHMLSVSQPLPSGRQNNVTTGKGVREMEDSEMFEDKHDAVIVDLLTKLEEESYTQLVKKVANGSINALREAGHIVVIMKAVGLI